LAARYSRPTAESSDVWVRPELVARVEFTEWTEGDRLRHSKFAGLHDDKNARGVVKEDGGKA